jgi:sugar diacid utilization regulator
MESSASDVLTMHRLGRRIDGGAAIVGWLARRTGCWVGLVDRSGTVLVGDRAALDDTTTPALAKAAQDMAGRGLRAFGTADGSACRIVLLQVDAPDRAAPILAVVGTQPVPQTLTAGAATVLGTSWWAERTRRARQHLDAVDARTREAVLHLLMSRQASTARRIAAVLGPPLPDHARLHVVACPPNAREAVLASCRRWAARSAFVVACPVHHGHVIVIVPTGAVEPGADCLADALTDRHPGCAVGTSDVVALSDTPAGYEQAFHALTVARGRPDRRARFDASLDPATLLGTAGAGWAHALLAPLTGHVPARATDPDAEELVVTLRSWLSFSTGAARLLKIHRNTLRARLERIEELLGIDLERTDQQAPLSLALRTAALRGTPDPHVPVATLEDLVRLPALVEWANTILRPVRVAPNAMQLESTLRAWLDANARLSVAAAALDISVPGARKRLQRLEQLLQRSLLHAPHVRHDLWLAVRAADG